jgi:glycosyltransferase involved in cell wall biosynthesis
MITYNHEAFIAEAIEGVLMQQTTFPIELVIGEDLSTDGTRAICLDYQSRFPDVIRVLTREKNLGMSAGLRETLKNCKGEFVAICEGDDYWTEPRKLAMQVDLLEEHPEYSACCHNAQVVYEDTGKRVRYASEQPDSFDFLNIVRKEFSIPSCSFIYRRALLADELDKLVLLDWVMYLVLSSKGNIKFLDSDMAVYRQHSGGWTNRSWTKNAKELIDLTVVCKEYFGPDFADEFDRILAHDKADLCFSHFQDGNIAAFTVSLEACRPYWHLLSARKRAALAIRARVSRIPLIMQGYRTLTTKLRDMVASRSRSAYLR